MMIEYLTYLTFANTQNLHFRVSSANIQKYADKSWKCINIYMDFHDLSVCFAIFILIWMSFPSPFCIIIRAFQQQ